MNEWECANPPSTVGAPKAISVPPEVKSFLLLDSTGQRGWFIRCSPGLAHGGESPLGLGLSSCRARVGSRPWARAEERGWSCSLGEELGLSPLECSGATENV